MMPLTAQKPKPLLLYDGRPLIEWALSALPNAVDEIVIVVGYLGAQIRAHVGEAWGGKRVRYIEQPTLNGTGGALLAARAVVHDRLLVLYADDVFERGDLERLAATSESMAMLVCRRAVEKRVRTMELDDAGRLIGVRESRADEQEAIIFTGACVVDQRIFGAPFVPVPGHPNELSLPDTLVALAHGEGDTGSAIIRAVFAKSWTSISVPEDLR